MDDFDKFMNKIGVGGELLNIINETIVDVQERGNQIHIAIEYPMLEDYDAEIELNNGEIHLIFSSFEKRDLEVGIDTDMNVNEAEIEHNNRIIVVKGPKE